ncbi:MAG: adenylate/guanylate cyclase domain-containing protein [Elusimicrobiota bacterium]
MLKRIIKGLMVSGLIALLALLLRFGGFFLSLEFKTLDWRFDMRGPRRAPDNVVIINIDEESIAENNFGRWPWSRDVHAKMIDLLASAKAKAIVFDVLFPEPDTLFPEEDMRLVKSTKMAGNVIYSMFMQLDGKKIKRITGPIPGIEKAAARVGYANYIPEWDGAVRKMLPVLYDNDKKYYSLSIEAISFCFNKSPDEIIKSVFLDRNGELTINFTGGYGNFRYLPYYKVLRGDIPLEFFKDKVVLIGATAAGLYDRHPIPFSPSFPGVEIHANVISSILNNEFMIGPRETDLYKTLVIIVILMGIGLSVLSPWWATALTGVSALSYFIISQVVFSKYNLWLELFPAFFVIFGSYVLIILSRMILERREKSRIRKTFSYYLSPDVIKSVLSKPGGLELGGKKNELSILFSDIVGFTSISEALSPEEIVALLNEYLTAMTDVVFKYQGTLDKFIGDAVMAFWNAPLPQENHAELALRCAVEMIDVLKSMQEKWRKEGKRIIDIGIGINTGEAIVGNMGSFKRMNYTVIGDNVNLASRIEGLTRDFKTHIIISEAAYQKVKDIVEVKSLGGVKVKGKENETQIYEVLRICDDASQKTCEIIT